MTPDEAIKTAREALKEIESGAGRREDVSGIIPTMAIIARRGIAALDLLAAESNPLDPEIQTLVQDNFWELAGKPKATEPSEDAVISGTFKNVSSHDHAMNEEEIKNFYRDTDGETVDPSEDVPIIHGKAELEAHDERIRLECADKAIEYIATGNYGSDTGLRAAIMGEAKK